MTENKVNEEEIRKIFQGGGKKMLLLEAKCGGKAEDENKDEDEEEKVVIEKTVEETKEEVEGKDKDEERGGKNKEKRNENNPKRETRGFWEVLNAKYPWIKVAVAIIALLTMWEVVRGYKKGPEPTEDFWTSGLYSELGLTAPIPKKITEADLAALEGKKLVALTFDDGPLNSTTPRLLDTLKKNNVRVTFFMLGTMVERYPGIVRRARDEGHEIASHTTWHNDLSKQNVEQVRGDMAESCRIFEQVLGKCVDLVRPPYGAINDATRQGLERPLILWSVDTEDWKSKDAQKILEEAKRAAFDGAIILMHDIYPSSVDAVSMVVSELRKDGYEFVTVSELAKARGDVMERGAAYRAFVP